MSEILQDLPLGCLVMIAGAIFCLIECLKGMYKIGKDGCVNLVVRLYNLIRTLFVIITLIYGVYFGAVYLNSAYDIAPVLRAAFQPLFDVLKGLIVF